MEEKDYKKLYKDVLERAKNGLKDKNYYLSQSAKEVTEFLFPQLKETEDEKVKRELTTFLIDFNSGYYSRPSENEIDSWIKWIDKKCEQKPVDKVEPKFKVGDWTIYNDANVYQVKEIDYTNIIPRYELENIYGYKISIPFTSDYNLRNWNIEDAKDGDVLYTTCDNTNEMAFIYNGIEFDAVHCYFLYSKTNNEYKTFNSVCSVKAYIHPATKEQCELLFSKMKEAGYEWDPEKKELKKIEQVSTWNEKIKGLSELEIYILSLVPDRSLDAIKVDTKNIKYIINKEQNPAWSEEDESGFGEVLWAIKQARSVAKDENDMGNLWYAENWLKSLKYRMQPQQKQEWSEEDEKKRNGLVKGLEDRMGFGWANQPFTREEYIEWLKSLKDRVQPQPKQEWSEEDKSMYIRTLGILGKCYMGELPTKVEEELKWFKSITDKAYT